MSLREDSVDTEKPSGVCSLAFIKEKFSELFVYPSIFSIKNSRST